MTTNEAAERRDSTVHRTFKHWRSEPQDYDPTPHCQGCHQPWVDRLPTEMLQPCPESVAMAERRATVERIRAAIGPELEVPKYETIYAAYERTGHNVLLREVRAILDEEAAR